MLILKSLSLEPMHGWGITIRVEQITKNVLQVNPDTGDEYAQVGNPSLLLRVDWHRSPAQRMEAS